MRCPFCWDNPINIDEDFCPRCMSLFEDLKKDILEIEALKKKMLRDRRGYGQRLHKLLSE